MNVNIASNIIAAELNDVANLENARYETKFVVNAYLHHRMQEWLRHNKMAFRMAHPARMVNNIYFDTHDLDAYCENLSGIKTRSKIRLRWYGPARGAYKATIELKSKENKIGWKHSEPMVFSKHLEELTFSELVKSIEVQLSSEMAYHFAFSNIPILFNRYERDYYVSANGKVRVTLDKNLIFYDQRTYINLNTKYANFPVDVVIMEFKYAARDLDLGISAVDTIEIPPKRCSKYVLGVQAILGE